MLEKREKEREKERKSLKRDGKKKIFD